MTCFCLKPAFETVVHGECREVVVCVLQIAIFACRPLFWAKLSLLPSKPYGWDFKRKRRENGMLDVELEEHKKEKRVAIM